ncbi:hypothetical protein F5X99DRAFT_404263 [Biscogniauxia marginata]|nr:hypothetical protein F5X99DRAFT_404263 [Biscogniauxia marginata]
MQLLLSLIVAASALSLATTTTAMMYRRACVSGTYQCSNPTNGTSTVQVCSAGFWVLAAICGEDWTCVADAAGGCTCRK